MLVFLIPVSASAQPARSSPATPASEAEVRRLYADGAAHFDAKRYALAIESFRKAHELSGAPELLFNLGQAYRMSGPTGCAEARSAYEAYLRELPAAFNRATVEGYLAELRCEPPRVVRADEPSATTGELTTAARAPAEPRRSTSVRRRLAWASLGVGAAGAVTLAVAGGLGLASQRKLDRECGDLVCPPTLQDEVDRHSTLRLVAMVGAAVAAVGLGTSAALFWLDRRSAGAGIGGTF